MKNTVQARRKIDLKTSAPQAAPSHLKFAPEDCRDGSCPIYEGGYNMAVFGNREDGFLGGVSFEQKEYAAIETAAKRCGKNIGAWLADAIHAKIEADRLGPLHELEEATNQVFALQQLMEHHFLVPGDDGERSDSFKCGLVELSAGAFRRLRTATEGAFKPSKGN